MHDQCINRYVCAVLVDPETGYFAGKALYISLNDNFFCDHGSGGCWFCEKARYIDVIKLAGFSITPTFSSASHSDKPS